MVFVSLVTLERLGLLGAWSLSLIPGTERSPARNDTSCGEFGSEHFLEPIWVCRFSHETLLGLVSMGNQRASHISFWGGGPLF